MKHLLGKEVIIPAVLSCGECELCRSGRGNMCRAQIMPGNDMDGGFADYVVVPGRQACVLGEPVPGYELWELSVVADAVTTPYHALRKAGLKEGEVAVVIGVGGIGTYGVQLARALGARVLAIDIDDHKLAAISENGAEATLNPKGKGGRDVRKEISSLCKEKGWPGYGWRIFEMSGTAQGQESGFTLLSFTGSLSIVGFTMDKVQVRLSNLMAFDAEIYGNWGCLPEYYPEVVSLLRQGKITLKPFVEKHSLESINHVLSLAHEGKLTKRAIVVPRGR